MIPPLDPAKNKDSIKVPVRIPAGTLEHPKAEDTTICDEQVHTKLQCHAVSTDFNPELKPIPLLTAVTSTLQQGTLPGTPTAQPNQPDLQIGQPVSSELGCLHLQCDRFRSQKTLNVHECHDINNIEKQKRPREDSACHILQKSLPSLSSSFFSFFE